MSIGEIASRAGASPIPADRRFHLKERIFRAALRHLLARIGLAVRAGLKTAGPARG